MFFAIKKAISLGLGQLVKKTCNLKTLPWTLGIFLVYSKNINRLIKINEDSKCIQFE